MTLYGKLLKFGPIETMTAFKYFKMILSSQQDILKQYFHEGDTKTQ